MQAVFSLILVGELLSVALVVFGKGLQQFSWMYFGTVSFLVQWIVLSSAAMLCPLRPWFRRQNGIVAGSISYSIVLVMTVICSLVGEWMSERRVFQDTWMLLENLIVAAIFAGVVLRYFYLQQQLHNREQAELKSRIQALQSRIRPHFLFNSMNSIASLIDIDPDAAEKMVVDLSQLFRASLGESTLVNIEDEIALCRQFVSIEQTRLGDRLTVNWHIKTRNENAKIPSLLLQPLIENAIYHGVQPLPEGGTVDVHISIEAGYVVLCVKNPVDASHQADQEKHNGIAMENIRHRLQAYFGDQAQLDSDKSNDQFSVVIRYPVLLKET